MWPRWAVCLCVWGVAGVAGAARDEVRFGALFAVHDAPTAAGGRCGPVREHYGIQRVEATLLALDEIAANPALLRDVVLAADLRDSCWTPPSALRQTIDLVRDAVVTTDHRHCPQKVESRPLIGVLGPGASSAAAHVQNLLQLFGIPQLSYSATSRELSDRRRYSTFFRVVPSDLHQARLLVALLRAHNWSYVSAVLTDESYGQSGMAAFREEAARGGVCVAREEPLPAAPGPRVLRRTVRRLVAAGAPGVVLCWCEGRTARAVLWALSSVRPRPVVRLVGSDGWADRADVVRGVERAARGALTVRVHSPHLHHFDTHYLSLRPHSNHRNPWFTEFWEQKFNCTLSGNSTRYSTLCTGRESLAAGYSQEPKLALVVRGVYALAHALHDMRHEQCGGGRCGAFNVTLYRQYLARVRFTAPDGGAVAFDANGDPPPELVEYEVMEWVRGASGKWSYGRAGAWRGGRLVLAGGERAARRRAAGVTAACGAPCLPGWVARPERPRRCCWSCVPCPPLAVTSPGSRRCVLCPPGSRPDSSKTQCTESVVEWGGGESGAGRGARGVSGAAGAAGVALVVAVGGALYRHRHTPVVKSGSRELSALLLTSAAVCHAAAVAGVMRPSIASCAVALLAPPALCGVLAAVVTRTVRVARLVAAAERGERVTRLVSSRAQVVAWAALVAPSVTLSTGAVWVWGVGPRMLHPGRYRSVLQCDAEGAPQRLLPLVPALVLLAGSAVVAVRTRHLPHNLNETRLIGAAVYAVCCLWVAFFPLQAGAGGAGTPVLCACASLSASTCVCLSLGVRAWVCVCRPERNTRAAFVTSSLRCHVGGYRTPPRAPPSTLPVPRPLLREYTCPRSPPSHRRVLIVLPYPPDIL